MEYLYGGIIGATIVVAIDVLVYLYMARLEKRIKAGITEYERLEQVISEVYAEKKAKVEKALNDVEHL